MKIGHKRAFARSEEITSQCMSRKILDPRGGAKKVRSDNIGKIFNAFKKLQALIEYPQYSTRKIK